MQIEINNDTILLEIIHKNNKNIYMRVNKPGVLSITCHKTVTKKEIISIIEKNEPSIIKMLNSKKEIEAKNQYFWYLGKPYQPIFDEMQKNVIWNEDTVIGQNEKKLTKFYHQECIRIFTNEINRILPSFQNIPHFELKIRTMKTRWGVNNRRNNTITLNSELLKKDLDLIDYVIIHELCHYYEANHGPNFWRHVEQYYPKYKEARKRLRG